MATTAAPSDLKPERIDTYKNWQAEQNDSGGWGFFVEDVNTLPLEPWDLKGVPCRWSCSTGRVASMTRMSARFRRWQDQAAETPL